MLNLRTPGVYLREVEVAVRPLLRMSVAGFTGQAERGPLNRPQVLNSWGQFRDIFGDFTGYSYLAYTVFGFFLNGGERCYVVRVAHETARLARAPLTSLPVALLKKDIPEGATQARLSRVKHIFAGAELVIADKTSSARVRVTKVTGGEGDEGVITFVNTAHKDGVAAPVPKIKEEATVARVLADVYAINEGAWGNSVSVRVEQKSTRDVVLAELEKAVAAGDTTARLTSVAGLAGADVAGNEQADAVTLVHQRDPIREKLVIKAIDYTTREVTFAEPITSEYGYPSGSAVVGRGFKLIVRHQPGGRLLREEVFDNLTLDPKHANYFVSVVNGEPEETDYVKRIKDGHSILVRLEDLNGAGDRPAGARPARLDALDLTGGADDPARLDVRYHTGYEGGAYFRPVPPNASPAVRRETEEKLFGLAGFEAVNEVGLIVAPDLIIPDYYKRLEENQIQLPAEGIIFARIPVSALTEETLVNFKAGQHEMLAHCERMGDRFAVLDSPRGAEAAKGANPIEEWPGNFSLAAYSKNGALYYPWLKEKTSDFDGRNLFIPPSGHVAGIYARTEQRDGIGHAPANEVLRGVVEFETCLTDAEQSLLNPKSVNCLRSFPGRGLLVWGARTLSNDSAWRYVNVRRLYLAITKQIIINLKWTVFEPNGRGLWDRIVASLSLFMRDLFARGALAGTKPEEAFFVKCDEETNPPEIIDAGQVVTLIGFAPARPGEFILVTVKRTAESVSVREQG